MCFFPEHTTSFSPCLCELGWVTSRITIFWLEWCYPAKKQGLNIITTFFMFSTAFMLVRCCWKNCSEETCCDVHLTNRDQRHNIIVVTIGFFAAVLIFMANIVLLQLQAYPHCPLFCSLFSLLFTSLLFASILKLYQQNPSSRISKSILQDR